MGELQTTVSNISAEGGSQEFLEYYTQHKGPLITLLQNYAAKLNSFYNKVAQNNTNVTQLAELRRQAMQAQIEQREWEGKKIHDIVNEMLHESSKGGADILKKGLQAKFDELERADRKQVYNKLSQIRNDIYNTQEILQQEAEFKALVLEGMQLIYKIREDFTGEIAEDIAITFREGSYVKMIRIPMQTYLQHAMSMTKLTTEAFSKELSGDPFKLQMRKNKTVIDQLIKLSGGQQPQFLTFVDIYKELKNNIYFLREDDDYFVVTKGQGGFVAEALVRAYTNDAEFEYRQDREAWYQEADVLDKATKQGISVKNFIDSSPTLLRINSLHTVINQLINALSSNLPPGDIVEHIRTNIFHATGDIDAAKEKMVEKLVEECLHV